MSSSSRSFVTTKWTAPNRQTLSKEDRVEIKKIFVPSSDAVIIHSSYPPSGPFDTQTGVDNE